MRLPALLLSLPLSVVLCTPAFAQGAGHAAEAVDLELVGEQRALVPGTRAWLGLHLRHAPDWHSYWINPGDSGLPTRLTWRLPAGWRAGDIAWPAPTRFEVGGLYNFGYDGDVLLPVPVDVPADARIGDTVTLAVEARWLVCREECVPGKATLHIERPIARDAAPDESRSARFASARAARPRPVDWHATARVEGERIAIEVHAVDLPQDATLDVFSVQRRLLGNAPPRLRREDGVLHIDAPKSDAFDEPPPTFDLVLTNGSARAMQVRVVFAAPSARSLPR